MGIKGVAIYRRIESTRKDEIGNLHLCYGIRADFDTPDGSCSLEIADISSYPSRVDRLVQLLNRYQASPTHFKELVEDFIAEE